MCIYEYIYEYIYIYEFGCSIQKHTHKDTHTCIHTYIHTYIHICILPDVHTYIHTYIHTHIYILPVVSASVSPTYSWRLMLLSQAVYSSTLMPFSHSASSSLSCIRQHTSAYVSVLLDADALAPLCLVLLVLRTSAYVSIRQHTPAHVSIRQWMCLRQAHTSAYVSISE
jgi:hypothetical protein